MNELIGCNNPYCDPDGIAQLVECWTVVLGARQSDENQLKTVILPKSMGLSIKLPKNVFEQRCHLVVHNV